jgi:hypothetical protein
MRLVVADTGPLNYLVLIDAVELLPNLFEKVFAPRGRKGRIAKPGRAGGRPRLGDAAADLARGAGGSLGH